ncbi:MAG: type III pantothenate kinase [Sphingobacteriales bacterium]|nr:MAG: type III pantothenate kinase [Sphingobacteriales bacterium]
MSATLCIDWGNSRVKAAIFKDKKLVEVQNFSDSEAANSLASLISQHQPTKGILCSVVKHPQDVEQMLRENLRHFSILDSNTRVPIMNAYTTPGTLGADRLATVVAAHMLNPDKNNLVISVGTCITYNFIQKTRTYRGGAISPGLHMRLKAMNQFTDRLPEVKVDGDLLLLGYDTDTCMRSGAIFGMAAEMDGMIDRFASQYPDFNAILTGGDGPFFASKLKNKIFADPDLLLKGLNLIVDYNVPQLQ